MLHVLRATLSKIDADPAPTFSLLEFRHILVHRIENLEATLMQTQAKGTNVQELDR